MKDIVILGTGGLAREVAFLIEEINRETPIWRILGFAEAEEKDVGAQIGNYSVAYCEDDLLSMEVAAVIGIGDPRVIQKVAERFSYRRNVSFPNLIHPNAVWDQERFVMGCGNVVCAGSTFTTDIKIGSFNYFNLSCTYGHDIEVQDYCVFNPGVNLSGGVRVGSGCLVGTGATILQYLNIGDGATVGAGALVSKDVEANTTVIGVPARRMAAKPT